tara:strand:- start:361 stop:933 length:573 start_codon:yes stop_codon:yes gene_type:complete
MRPGIGMGCLGIHSFDLINSIVDNTILSVTGWLDEAIGLNPRGDQYIDPGGLVVINYENGVRGIVSQLEDGAGPMSVEINLTNARIRVDEKFGRLEIASKRTDNLKSKKPLKYKVDKNPVAFSVSHNVIELMECIINELISDKKVECSASHGERSLEILVAAYISNEKGNQPVNLPLVDTYALKKNLHVT